MSCFLYEIKIVVKQYKNDEFVEFMRTLSHNISKQKGCLAYSVYRESVNENTYSVMGKWRTRQAMDKHFKTQDFEVLIGAAKVLGETSEMNIAEVLQTGDLKLASKQIASQDKVTQIRSS